MKLTLRIAGIVVAVLLIAIIVLPFTIDVNNFRPKLEAELSSGLGRQVKVGNLKLSLWSGSVAAEELSIADDPSFSQEGFVHAKALRVGLEIRPLIFSKKLNITELTLEQPEITLLRSDAGVWNFASLGGNGSSAGSTDTATPQNENAGNASPQASQNFVVKKLEVKDGQLTVSQMNSNADSSSSSPPAPHVYQRVNIVMHNLSLTAQFPFRVTASLPENGEIQLNGHAGPISMGDITVTPFDAKIRVKQLDLAASGFAELFPGVAGIADFNGLVSSDGQQLHTEGTLDAQQLKLVENGSPAGRPLELKYAVDHQLQTTSGTVTQGDISMGKAFAQLTGNYQTQDGVTILDMKLDAQNMPVNDLEAMLPALGVVLPSGSSLNGGTLTTNLTISGAANNPVISGPIRLSNSKLARFNLGSKLSAISKLAGGKTGADTSIQTLSTEARIGPEGVRTEKINLVVPAFGTLTGEGTISPGGALEFHMNADLNGGAVTTLQSLTHLGSGGVSLPFFIRGTTSNPQFVPDAKGAAIGLAKSQLKKKVQSLLQPKQPGQPQQKSSVIHKFTGLFHKKQNN